MFEWGEMEEAAPLDFLPSPPLRGRGVGGEGVLFPSHANPLTPDPSPPKRGRGEEEAEGFPEGAVGDGEPVL